MRRWFRRIYTLWMDSSFAGYAQIISNRTAKCVKNTSLVASLVHAVQSSHCFGVSGSEMYRGKAGGVSS